jgi:hypothetical protein
MMLVYPDASEHIQASDPDSHHPEA